MKIGLDLRPAFWTRSGIGRYAGELGRALDRRDDVEPVFYAACMRRRIEPPWLEHSSARLFSLRWPSRLLSLGRFLGIGADTLSGGVPLFHSTDIVYPPVVRAKKVVTLHDVAFAEAEAYHEPEFRSSVSRRVRRMIPSADAIVVPTRFTAERVAEMYSIPVDTLDVIPHGGDHITRRSSREDDLFTSLGLSQPYLLSVGTIEPRKNYARMAEAFDRVVRRGYRGHWVIVGSWGWMTESIQAAFEKMASRDRVHLLLETDDAVLPALYENAQLLWYGSVYEGFGLPIIEAMALGVPVVTSNVGAMAEVGEDAVVSFDPIEVESMCDAIERCLREQGKWSKRSRARGQEFLWSKTAAMTVDVYRRVLGC